MQFDENIKTSFTLQELFYLILTNWQGKFKITGQSGNLFLNSVNVYKNLKNAKYMST